MPSPRRQNTTLARRALLAALAVSLAAGPAVAAAYEKEFSANSLIIPTQMEYQSDCSMVSAYGFIYTLLYKNAARVTAGLKPITVYWIIEPRKQSHHRCDTGTDTLPDFSRFNDNDGCDFAVESAAGQPVARLLTDGTEQANFTVSTTTYNTATGQSSRTGTAIIGSAAPNLKRVMKYGGGLWVIDAVDRAAVLDMLATDTDLQKLRSVSTCATTGSSLAGTRMVEIHSARANFRAPVAKIINDKPPLIALLGADAVTILESYLKNSGLIMVFGTTAKGTTTAHGVIFDVLYPLTDFVSTPTEPLGALNTADPADPTRTFYQVLWAPHWLAGQSGDTIPVDGDPGDDVTGDGKWTSGGDTAVVNTLRNIAAFAEVGNGIFAECASIESFEGSYLESASPCSGTYQCECLDVSPTPACPFGDIKPMGNCPSASDISACGACYQCATGYHLDAASCLEVKCVQDVTGAPAGYPNFQCGKYYKDCGTAYPGYTVFDYSDCNQVVCRKPSSSRKKPAVAYSPPTQPPSSASAGSCQANYTQVCVDTTTAVDVPGSNYSRFQVTNKLFKNGLDTFSGPDCSDAGVLDDTVTGFKYRAASMTGDCIDFHPETGGPGNLFSQKGNFNFSGTTGHIQNYQPPAVVGSYYRQSVFKFATSRNSSTASRADWDFTSARHKDGDPAKGMIVYLAGHTYANSPAGNRIVLNTLLNLGFSDTSVELARSEPVGYVTWGVDAGTRVKTAETVFQGTYEQHSPPGPYQDWINYNAASPHSWRFPYTDGHLRAYPLTSLTGTVQDFQTGASWDASAHIPAPPDRNIFTVAQGSANLGWKKMDFKYTQTDASTCLKGSEVDATGANICELSYALSKCSTAGIQTTDLLAGDPTGAKGAKLGMFVQQVRGHCSAHDNVTNAPIMEPTASQCDDRISRWQRNVARLGGVDHASPAIVGPSPYIHDEKSGGTLVTAWSERPVVAYVGARDGMLHAIYVSGAPWTSDAGTTKARSLATGLAAGTELWAFVPPGQLCGLATNDAMVDANVNVMDVFGNFPTDANGDGVFDLTDTAERPTGIRSWRTILVAAAGEGGSEAFALDITNPLRPALLWRLGGKENKDDRWDANANGAFGDLADHMSKTNPDTYANVWFDWDDGDSSTGHIPTDFNSTDPTTLDAIKFGRYDYRNMGKTYGTAIGTIWDGRAFRFVAYVSTTSADYTSSVTALGYQGLELFGIDLVNGQKLWQWERRYGRKNAAGTVIASNDVPGRPALLDVDSDGSVDRIYVGDIEGHLWELSATDGRNLNYLTTSSGNSLSFPLFGTANMLGTGADAALKDLYTPSPGSGMAQQPLTSPIGIGRFTEVPTALVDYLKDRMVVAQGTMGVDWAIAPFEEGHVYVVPGFPEAGTRLLPPINVSGSPDPRLYGVLKPAAVWDTVLGVGERVFGMPKIVDNQMFINTSFGSFTGDITSSMMDRGKTVRVNATGKTNIDDGQKRFGGVLIFGNDLVIASDVGLVRKAGEGRKGTVETRVRDRFTPTVTKSWQQLPDGNLP